MRRTVGLLALAVCLALGGCATTPVPSGADRTPSGSPTAPASGPTAGGSPSATIAPSEPPASAGPATTIYIHYYLWWTTAHWREKLGPGYPLSAASPPIPGSMDANGCSPRVSYRGATIVDLPQGGPYDQDNPATFDRHIEAAVAAGITGFLVSWQGTGAASQDPTSSGYDRRLDVLVQRVDAFNARSSVKFRLGLAFASFGDYSRPADEVVNDLQYFRQRYATDPAFTNRFSPKPIVMWLDSRKYDVATVASVSHAMQGSLFLLGDETASSWPRDAPYLDGTSYYWSSENPWVNRSAGAQIAALGSAVHAAGKPWFAPFIAGYDKELLGGGCVPRNGIATLQRVWSINAASQPDAWFGISWNEFVENTYLEPSVRYGTTYLDEIRRLAEGS